MDDMLLLPAEGVEEEATAPVRFPWIERPRRGAIRAWFQTVWMAMLRPARLMGSVPPSFTSGSAFRFALLTNLLACLATVGLFSFVPFAMALAGRRSMGGVLIALLMVLVVVAVATVAVAACMVIWGLVVHGLLRLTGPTRGGRAETARAIYLSSGANAVSAVPCLGVYVGWIWWLVSAVLMVRTAQRVSAARAVFSVAAPPLAAIVVTGLAYTLLMIRLVSSGAFLPPVAQTQPADVGAVVSALVEYADEHEGRGPRHVAELLWTGRLLPVDLFADGSEGKAARLRIAGSTAGQWESLPAPLRHNAIERIARTQPPAPAVYRCGDYVFTYGGVDFRGEAEAWWIVIQWPADAPLEGSETVRVGTHQGDVLEIPADEFTAAWEEQNALRLKHGLPALPHPQSQPADDPLD
jgi:hypothetical protein